MMYFVYDCLNKPKLMVIVKNIGIARRFIFRRNAYYRTARFFYTDKPLEENGTPHYCLTL